MLKITPRVKYKSPFNNGLSAGSLALILGLLAANLWVGLVLLFRGKAIDSYAYVQTTDGQIVSAERVHRLLRSDEVITRFASEWIVLALSWRGNGDEGMTAFNKKIPTHLFRLSWALAPNIRQGVAKAWITEWRTLRC